jgi:GAF domain-containing protein
MLEREQAPDAILMHAVQVLRRAFDFQRVLLCEAHGIATGYRLTYLDGKPLYGTRRHGVIEPTGADLFSAALLKGADVCIGEATDERVQRALPRWQRTACPDARSFLILTLAARNAAIGFVYADYARSNPSRLAEEEVALLKTIKAQIGLALKKAAHDRPVCA